MISYSDGFQSSPISQGSSQKMVMLISDQKYGYSIQKEQTLDQSKSWFKDKLPLSSEEDLFSGYSHRIRETKDFQENSSGSLQKFPQITKINSTLTSYNQCNKILFAKQDPTSQDLQKVCDGYISPPKQTMDSPKINTLKNELSAGKEDHLVNIPPKDHFNELLTTDTKNTTNQIPYLQIHTENRQQFPEPKDIQCENTQISSNEQPGSSLMQTSSYSTGLQKQTSNGSHKSSSRVVSKKNTQNSTYHANQYHNSNNLLITGSKRTTGVTNSNASSMNHGNVSSGNYPTNNFSNEQQHSANEGSTSNYQYYGGTNNNSTTAYPSSNLANSHINQNSQNIRNSSQSQAPQQYCGEEIEFSGYNDIYSGYYYPSYQFNSVEQISEGKKIEGILDEGQDLMTEEYKKYYQYAPQSSSYGYFQSQNTSIPSNEVLQPGTAVHNNVGQSGLISQNSHGVAAPQQSSNFVSEAQEGTENPQVLQNGYDHIADKYDHSYLRDYYGSNTYYPPSSYCYPPANEVYPITGSKKPSKKSSSGVTSHHIPQQQNSHSGQSKSQGSSFSSNSSKYQQVQTIYGSSQDGNGFHDPYNMQGINQSQQIYCDPSYYCTDPLYKKPQHNSNLENDIYKSESQKDNVQFHKEKSLKSNSRNCQREKTDLVDGYGNDNQESSPQNNQSTSHEIRKRKRKNNDQLKILKIEYQKGGFWGKEKILEVAQITGLSESQVYKWCWDQKKKRLETFKKRLGNKLITGQAADDDQQFEDMSGDGLDEDSYKQTGSPDKLLKLNDETGVVAIKANISKLSNDFTISQLQEKVLAGKSRVLQNITEKVMSRQNSKTDTEINPTLNKTINNITKSTISSSFHPNNNNGNNNNDIYDIQHEINGQENIHPDSSAHQLSVFQPSLQPQLQQSYEDTPKRVQPYTVF